MVLLVPIRYRKRKYSFGIKPLIQEVAGHFDKDFIYSEINYSLHTEYSYGPRRLTALPISTFKMIQQSHQRGIPMLWFNQQWAEEFYQFIRNITQGEPPVIIEIHPPFNDYCNNIKEFIKRYQVFEYNILSFYPKTKILIENRCGSLYKGGHFLISSVDDLLTLSELIEANSLKLRIALDIPQLFSTYGGVIKSTLVHSYELFESVKLCRELILGIHLWGKKRNEKGQWVSHMGDFTTYFDGNSELKEYFLGKIYDLFNDNIPRYTVLEVNSNDKDMFSITHDLVKSNFSFV
jgi:hypothetical protein